ncbi:putative DNA-binding protein [Rhodococcus sp. PvR044]|uniref:ribbon-helix-helix domain-containing protein n=1 Tax=Rhodococcus sp. PvR044 TaxID=3156402 RepID=UPI00339A4026
MVRAIGSALGERRTGALVRVALRNLLANKSVVTRALLAERRAAPREPFTVPLNIYLEDELRDALDQLAKKRGTTRIELVRIAIDRLLLRVENDRLEGRDQAIADEVETEIYRGDANRKVLIARHARRKARAAEGAQTD